MTETTAVADAPASGPTAAPSSDAAAAAASTQATAVGSENVIEIRNLSKIYRDFWGRKKVQALNSVSLDVKKGEIFGLLGPNGSGKTTTMKILLGLLFPSDGTVSVLGSSPDEVEMKARLGYLPEESYLYRFLNADETLDFYGRLFKLDKNTLKERKDRLIEMVGLGKARKRQLKEYSKGMTRRIGLAQALINDPDLVLLDEPTSGLDPLGTADMKEMIVDLRNQGKTVVMCSHLLADVQDVCDRIAILFQGELKVSGSVSELLTSEDTTVIETGTLSEDAIREVREVLARHGHTEAAVKHPTTTLEDLFLRTVAESQARPGRRFAPGERPDTVPADATPTDGTINP